MNGAGRPPAARVNLGPVKVLRLDHLVLAVSDLRRSIAFYRAVLGARIERQLQKPRIVQLRIGASLLDLVPRRRGGSGAPNLDHFALRVAPLDARLIRRRLARQGVEMGEIHVRYGADGYGPSVYFHDPDGNMVELKGPPTRPAIRRGRKSQSPSRSVRR